MPKARLAHSQTTLRTQKATAARRKAAAKIPGLLAEMGASLKAVDAILDRVIQRIQRKAPPRTSRPAAALLKRDATNGGKKTHAPVSDEQLVHALEALLNDHRAGRGDVLNRLAEGSDEHAQGAVPLRRILTLALFGKSAIPETPFHGGPVTCNEREHVALKAIGSGSAEKGAAVVVAAAKSWAKVARRGMVEWASRAVPMLEVDTPALKSIHARGLRSARLWELPVADRTWFVPLQDITDDAMKMIPGGEFNMAGVIVCAMALEWDRPGFPGRAFESPRKVVAA